MKESNSSRMKTLLLATALGLTSTAMVAQQPVEAAKDNDNDNKKIENVKNNKIASKRLISEKTYDTIDTARIFRTTTTHDKANQVIKTRFNLYAKSGQTFSKKQQVEIRNGLMFKARYYDGSDFRYHNLNALACKIIDWKDNATSVSFDCEIASNFTINSYEYNLLFDIKSNTGFKEHTWFLQHNFDSLNHYGSSEKFAHDAADINIVKKDIIVDDVTSITTKVLLRDGSKFFNNFGEALTNEIANEFRLYEKDSNYAKITDAHTVVQDEVDPDLFTVTSFVELNKSDLPNGGLKSLDLKTTLNEVENTINLKVVDFDVEEFKYMNFELDSVPLKVNKDKEVKFYMYSESANATYIPNNFTLDKSVNNANLELGTVNQVEKTPVEVNDPSISGKTVYRYEFIANITQKQPKLENYNITLEYANKANKAGHSINASTTLRYVDNVYNMHFVENDYTTRAGHKGQATLKLFANTEDLDINKLSVSAFNDAANTNVVKVHKDLDLATGWYEYTIDIEYSNIYVQEGSISASVSTGSGTLATSVKAYNKADVTKVEFKNENPTKALVGHKSELKAQITVDNHGHNDLNALLKQDFSTYTIQNANGTFKVKDINFVSQTLNESVYELTLEVVGNQVGNDTITLSYLGENEDTHNMAYVAVANGIENNKQSIAILQNNQKEIHFTHDYDPAIYGQLKFHNDAVHNDYIKVSVSDSAELENGKFKTTVAISSPKNGAVNNDLTRTFHLEYSKDGKTTTVGSVNYNIYGEAILVGNYADFAKDTKQEIEVNENHSKEVYFKTPFKYNSANTTINLTTKEGRVSVDNTSIEQVGKQDVNGYYTYKVLVNTSDELGHDRLNIEVKNTDNKLGEDYVSTDYLDINIVDNPIYSEVVVNEKTGVFENNLLTLVNDKKPVSLSIETNEKLAYNTLALNNNNVGGKVYAKILTSTIKEDYNQAKKKYVYTFDVVGYLPTINGQEGHILSGTYANGPSFKHNIDVLVNHKVQYVSASRDNQVIDGETVLLNPVYNNKSEDYAKGFKITFDAKHNTLTDIIPNFTFYDNQNNKITEAGIVNVKQVTNTRNYEQSIEYYVRISSNSNTATTKDGIKAVVNLVSNADDNKIPLKDNNGDVIETSFNIMPVTKVEAMSFEQENHILKPNQPKTIKLNIKAAEFFNHSVNKDHVKLALTNLTQEQQEQIKKLEVKECGETNSTKKDSVCEVVVEAATDMSFGIVARYELNDELKASTNLNVIEQGDIEVVDTTAKVYAGQEVKSVVKTSVDPTIYGGLTYSFENNNDNNFVNSPTQNLGVVINETVQKNGEYLTTVTYKGHLASKTDVVVKFSLKEGTKVASANVNVVDHATLLDVNKNEVKDLTNLKMVNGTKQTYYLKVLDSQISNNTQITKELNKNNIEVSSLTLITNAAEKIEGYKLYKVEFNAKKLSENNQISFNFNSNTTNYKSSVDLVIDVNQEHTLSMNKNTIFNGSELVIQEQAKADLQFISSTNNLDLNSLTFVNLNTGEKHVELSSCTIENANANGQFVYNCKVSGLEKTIEAGVKYQVEANFTGTDANATKHTIKTNEFLVKVVKQAVVVNATRTSIQNPNVKENITNQTITYELNKGIDYKHQFNILATDGYDLTDYDVDIKIDQNKEVIEQNNLRSAAKTVEFDFAIRNEGVAKVVATLTKDGTTILDENNNPIQATFNVKVEKAVTLDVDYSSSAFNKQGQIALYDNGEVKEILFTTNTPINNGSVKIERVNNQPSYVNIVDNTCGLVSSNNTEFNYRCKVVAAKEGVTHNEVLAHKLVVTTAKTNQVLETSLDAVVNHKTSYLDLYQDHNNINEQTIRTSANVKQNISAKYDANLEANENISMQIKYYHLDGNKYEEMNAKEINDYLDVQSTFNANEKTHNFSISLKKLNSKYFDIKVVTTLMDGNNVVQDENNQDLTNYFILQAAPSLQTLKFASENYQFAKNETKTIILQATPMNDGYTRNLELNVEDLEFAITNLSPRDLEKVTLKTPENCEYKGGKISAYECKVEVSASEALEFGLYADYAHKLESGQASTSLSVVDAPNLNVDRDLIQHGLLVQTKDVQEFEIKTDVNPELFGGLKLSSKKNQDNNYINSTNYNIRYDLEKLNLLMVNMLQVLKYMDYYKTKM